jgi:hypothetical protein
LLLGGLAPCSTGAPAIAESRTTASPLRVGVKRRSAGLAHLLGLSSLLTSSVAAVLGKARRRGFRLTLHRKLSPFDVEPWAADNSVRAFHCLNCTGASSG